MFAQFAVAPLVVAQAMIIGTPPVLPGKDSVPDPLVKVWVENTGAELSVWTPVNVWAASVRAIVADVDGSATVVVAAWAKVVLNAPVVTKFPASVIVDDPLFTPVPPYVPTIGMVIHES